MSAEKHTPAPMWTADTPQIQLRDWFAGQALAGFAAGLTHEAVDDHGCSPRARDRVFFSDLVKDAYTVADAMLAAREA